MYRDVMVSFVRCVSDSPFCLHLESWLDTGQLVILVPKPPVSPPTPQGIVPLLAHLMQC